MKIQNLYDRVLVIENWDILYVFFGGCIVFLEPVLKRKTLLKR